MTTDRGPLGQLTMSFGPSIRDAHYAVKVALLEAWAATYGKAEFSATWEPERGVAAFAEAFYDGGAIPSLPVIQQDGDNLSIQDYDGLWFVIKPGGTFEYGPRVVPW